MGDGWLAKSGRLRGHGQVDPGLLPFRIILWDHRKPNWPFLRQRHKMAVTHSGHQAALAVTVSVGQALFRGW